MENRIHPTAIIGGGAVLGDGVEVGAYAYIGEGVVLGEGCRIHHHATVEGHTTLGAGCEVFPYACLGLKTQDLKYAGGRPGLRVGARNVFREFVTVHAATRDGEFTTIGDDNHFLAYVHVAHDCRVGSHVVASNNATLAGHVQLGNHVVIGGFGGIHQFCRIGDHAMISACAKVVKDVPPFMLVDGVPAVVRGINRVGLERRGFDARQLDRIKAVHRTLYRSGLNRAQALEKLDRDAEAASAEFAAVRDFAAASERGLCGGSD